MDCYFRQYWRDERLGFTGLKKNTQSQTIDQLSLNVKMLEKIWKPDTYFHNGLSSYLHTITRPNKLLRISEHGDITYSMRWVLSQHNILQWPLQYTYLVPLVEFTDPIYTSSPILITTLQKFRCEMRNYFSETKFLHFSHSKSHN